MKPGRHLMLGFNGTTIPDWLIKAIKVDEIGGVIFYKRNVESKEQLIQEIKKIKSKAKYPILVAVDHEGGRVFRLPKPFTPIATMREIGREYPRDPDIGYKIGSMMARELKEVGFNVNFAPVLDVDTNPINPIIGDRAFSSDPGVVSNLGCQLINGLQENGVMACGKHFPGHGDTELDSHEKLPIVKHDMERLDKIELVPFRTAIRAGVDSIMTAHIVYERLDARLPVTLSSNVIGEMLRSSLSFNKVIFTDDLCMKAIADNWGIADAASMAINVGCDIAIIANEGIDYRELVENIEKNVSKTILKRSLERVTPIVSKYS